MRHIPIAFELLGVLGTLYVLVLMFDTKARNLRAASRRRARITPHEPDRSSFDPAYIRCRARFVAFEARCFKALCDFVRADLDNLLDCYYSEGHESMDDFPAWTFERYLRESERTGALEYYRQAFGG